MLKRPREYQNWHFKLKRKNIWKQRERQLRSDRLKIYANSIPSTLLSYTDHNSEAPADLIHLQGHQSPLLHPRECVYICKWSVAKMKPKKEDFGEKVSEDQGPMTMRLVKGQTAWRKIDQSKETRICLLLLLLSPPLPLIILFYFLFLFLKWMPFCHEVVVWLAAWRLSRPQLLLFGLWSWAWASDVRGLGPDVVTVIGFCKILGLAHSWIWLFIYFFWSSNNYKKETKT